MNDPRNQDILKEFRASQYDSIFTMQHGNLWRVLSATGSCGHACVFLPIAFYIIEYNVFLYIYFFFYIVYKLIYISVLYFSHSVQNCFFGNCRSVSNLNKGRWSEGERSWKLQTTGGTRSLILYAAFFQVFLYLVLCNLKIALELVYITHDFLHICQCWMNTYFR